MSWNKTFMVTVNGSIKPVELSKLDKIESTFRLVGNCSDTVSDLQSQKVKASFSSSQPNPSILGFFKIFSRIISFS